MDPITMATMSSFIRPALGAIQTGVGFLTPIPDRPEMEIPESAQAALGSAELQSTMTRLPGQASIEGRLDRVTANTLNTIERLGDSPVANVNAAARAYGNQLDKETELGIKGGEMWLRNQDVLRTEQNRMANWEQKKWQTNEMDPYMSKVAAISAMRGAGIQNLTGGLQDILGVLSKFGYANTVLESLQDKEKTPEDVFKMKTETKPIQTGVLNPSFENSETPEMRGLMELINLMPQ